MTSADRLPVVWIKWMDSTSRAYGRWLPRDEVAGLSMKDMEMETVGFLFDETDHAVTLVQSHYTDEVAAVFDIPKGCILQRKELKVGR